MVNFKIRVRNKEENKEIQQILFGLGFCWRSGWRKQSKEILYLDSKNLCGIYILIYDEREERERIITYSSNLNDFYGERKEYKIISFKKLKSKKFQEYLVGLMVLNKL